MIRRANTLPGDRKLPLRNFDVGAGWAPHPSGPHACRCNHKGLDLVRPHRNPDLLSD